MSSTLQRVIALSLAALAATVTSCSSSASPGTSTPSPTSTHAAQNNYPFTIENCGRTYTYTQAPTRVLAGWPKTVETLDALGVGSTLIGYLAGKFGPAPQGSTVKALTAEYAPAAETILTAKPDFFLANGDTQLSGSQGSVTPDDLSKIGANTYVMGNDCKDFKGGTTVDTVYQDITNLGRIFNVSDKAAALNSTLRARVAAAAGLRGSAPAPKIAYVQVFEDKLYALSGLSYNAQVEGVGGANILTDPNQRFGEISAEEVLTSMPTPSCSHTTSNLKPSINRNPKSSRRSATAEPSATAKSSEYPTLSQKAPAWQSSRPSN